MLEYALCTAATWDSSRFGNAAPKHHAEAVTLSFAESRLTIGERRKPATVLAPGRHNPSVICVPCMAIRRPIALHTARRSKCRRPKQIKQLSLTATPKPQDTQSGSSAREILVNAQRQSTGACVSVAQVLWTVFQGSPEGLALSALNIVDRSQTSSPATSTPGEPCSHPGDVASRTTLRNDGRASRHECINKSARKRAARHTCTFAPPNGERWTREMRASLADTTAGRRRTDREPANATRKLFCEITHREAEKVDSKST